MLPDGGRSLAPRRPPAPPPLPPLHGSDGPTHVEAARGTAARTSASTRLFFFLPLFSWLLLFKCFLHCVQSMSLQCRFNVASMSLVFHPKWFSSLNTCRNLSVKVVLYICCSVSFNFTFTFISILHLFEKKNRIRIFLEKGQRGKYEFVELYCCTLTK